MGYSTLVSTERLAAHLDDPAWVVVDCRFSLGDPAHGRRAFRGGHIPGARYAHLEEDLSDPPGAGGRHPLPDPDALAIRIGRWGIDNDTQVVAYDDSFGSMAARLWWLLRWLGHERVALLDGGWPRWKREGRPVATALTCPVTRPFRARLRQEMIADAGAVQAGLAAGDIVLLDARPEERFEGSVEPFDPVAGHIPGAVNRPWEDNLDLSGDYLPAGELREAYEGAMDGLPPRQVIHMCGSGVTACHSVLAMEVAGLPGSRLYPGSWSEWITDPARPIATGD